MQMNSKTDNPIRKAKARAMLLVLALPLVPSFIMKKSAAPKLPMMVRKAIATKYVMPVIIN